MYKVIGEPFRLPHMTYAVLCRCSCGVEKTVQLKGGKAGVPVSLECIKCKRKRIIHGHSTKGGQSKTYAVWHAMIDRCYNKNCRSYVRYGQRGIVVDEKWKKFSGFLEDMGTKPEGFSIERKDVNSHYNKENCMWIPMLDQSKNRRDLRFFEHKGEKLYIAEIIRRFGINRDYISKRLKKGWSIEKIIESKVK